MSPKEQALHRIVTVELASRLTDVTEAAADRMDRLDGELLMLRHDLEQHMAAQRIARAKDRQDLADFADTCVVMSAEDQHALACQLNGGFFKRLRLIVLWIARGKVRR